MSFWSKLFGGGALKSIENIALEAIETDKESAEAKALCLKAIDPNGLMRRSLSNRVSFLYTIYILLMLSLLLLSAFNIGNSEQIKQAIEYTKDLFVPITTSFTAIISASFGVNAMNVSKSK